MMFKAMLEAAVNWMRAGLPLQLLKIVIYTRGITVDADNELLEIFHDFKRRVEKLSRVPDVSV